MNEEALQYSYDLFKKDGYNGSFDDYKKLIKEDTEALDYSYKLFSSDGYDGAIEDFTKLITTEPVKEGAVATETAPAAAVKEAVDTGSTSEDGSLGSQETQPLNSKFEAYFNKQQEDLGIDVPKIKELPVQEQEDFLNATEQLFPGSKQDFKTAAYKPEIKEEAQNIFKNRLKDLKTTDLGTVDFDDKKSIENFRKKSLIDFTSNNPVIQNEIIPKVKKEVEPQINEYVKKSMIKYNLNDPKNITQENLDAFNKDVGGFYNSIINTKIASNQEFKAITNAFDESMNDMSSGYLRDFTKSKDMPLLFSLAQDVKDTWYLNEAIFGTIVKGLTSAVTGYRSMKSSVDETGTNLLIKETTDKIVDFKKNKALASEFGWDDSTEGYFTDDPTNPKSMQFKPKYAKDSRSLDSQGLPVSSTKTNYKPPRSKTITWGDFQNKIKNYTKEKDDLARKNLVEIQNENEVLQNYNDNELDEIFKGNDIVSNLISLSAEQLPQMALSLLTLGATGAVQMGGDIYTQGIDNEARKRFNIPEDKKVSIEQKRDVFLDKDFMDALEVKSVAGGFVTGQLERFGAGKALKPFVTKGTQSVLRTGYKNFLKNSANNLVSNTQNSSIEAITEVAQEIIVAGASGGELSTGQIFDSGATGFLVSMTTGLGGNIKNQTLAEARASSKIIAGKLNPKSSEATFNFKIKEVEDLAKKEIDPNIKKDLIEKRDILIETRNASSSIPKDFSVDSRSKAIDLLVKKKQLEKQIEGVDPEFVVAQKEQINNINKELQQVAIDNRLEKNISSISKIVEDIESVDLKVMEPNELKSFLEKQTKLFNGKTKESKIAEAMASQGFIFQDPNTGKQSIIINKDVARKTRAVNVAGHEFLHALLFETLKNNPEAQKNLGNSLKEYINKIDIDQVKNSEFKRRLQEYNDKPENVQAEEVLTLFSDAIATGDMKFNESIATKIGDIVRRLMQSLGVKIKFNEGKDVYKFIKDYNKSAFKGKLTKSQKEAFKGVKGSLVPIKAVEGDVEVKQSKPSKVADIESQIETLEDKYDDGLLDYDDYEQQLDNLESKLEKAKNAPVEEKVVSKPKTKEAVENTKETIKKASDKVFKETEVSERNKAIAKVNEDIANEMLELGANSISDIKDPAKRKAIVDKLGKNNLGAVTNLTKKAAAVGKDLAIDSNLKIGYDEFFSGFSEELSALIKTYKVKVDGKKVPFGAYMNKNLSLRYGQILDKALKGRVQNAQSLDVEAGSVGSVREIAAEGARDFDAYTSADRGLPAGELIDVTKFRKVKNNLSNVEEVIDLKDVEVGDLTYKKVVDEYAGPVGAAIIGLHDKNAAPDPNETRNKFQKLAERIEGTRTLNYGKETGGEAEVRAMQGLFLDYNDALKFIKTIPEFNVAPFETTIDKQGKSVDLTTDARGYSVGTSNVILKELYDVYIDPKSKSSSKDVKSRSITSPSGRGKGKSSQVAKVYRLKDKYRGRVSRETVKALQKTIGITEAGEAFIPMKGVNRTKFGTALQGLTKIYAANVANTVIRKDIVDKGITSDKKPTEKVLADIGGGKSSVMFSKATDLGLNMPVESPMLGEVLFSKKARAEYESVLKNKRPDLEDPNEQVDNLIKWGDSLDIPDNQKTKYKKLGLYYMANGYVIMPEDGYKVTEAIRLGKANKVDPYSVKNPNELIEKYQAKTKGVRLNPDKVKQFSNKTVLKEGVVVYDVEDSKKGQIAVRKAIDTNWGEKANPWCLAARANVNEESRGATNLQEAQDIARELELDGYTVDIVKINDDLYNIDGNKKVTKENELDKAFKLWKNYNSDGNGFKIAFQNGKLTAFRDGNNTEWWDRMDVNSNNIPLKTVKKGDKKYLEKITEENQMDPVTGESFISSRKIENTLNDRATVVEFYIANPKTKKLKITNKTEKLEIEENIFETTKTEYTDDGNVLSVTDTVENKNRKTYISTNVETLYNEDGSVDAVFRSKTIKGKKFLESERENTRNGEVVFYRKSIELIDADSFEDLGVYLYEEMKGEVTRNIDKREEFGYVEGEGEYDVMFSKNVEPIRSEKVYKKFEKDLKGFKLYHGGEISTSQNSNVSERNMLTWFWVNDLDGALAHNQDDTSVPIYEVNFDNISGDKIIVPDFEYMPYTIIKQAVEKVYYKGYKPAVVLTEGKKGSDDEMDNFGAPSVLSDPKANEIVKEFLDWSYKNNEAYEYNFGIPFVENGKIAEGLPVIVVGEIPSSNLKQVNQSSENTNVLFSLKTPVTKKPPTTSSLVSLFIKRAQSAVQPKTRAGKLRKQIGEKKLNKIITKLLYTKSYQGDNEFFEAKEKLEDYQKDIVDYVFEGKEWMYGLFSDEQAFLNNGVKYEKIIRRAIKELKLKDISVDLSQGGFGSGVDLVLSIKGKDINIELKLNKNAQFGSFSIRKKDGKYVYTEGINGLKEKLPDLDTKIQEELNSKEYQENFKAFIDEALKNGGKLDEVTGKLTGPEQMFKHLVKEKFLEELNINIKEDSKGKKLDEKIINLIYNNKDVYNIEIGGKGLYYLGENKDNLPIPKLESDTSLMIRQTYNQLGKSGVYALVNRAFLNLDSNIVESNINFSDLNNIEKAVETLMNFSKSTQNKLSEEFNKIIENKTGIKADDTISQVKAKMLANSKRRFNIFIPPSAEDFVGLLYATLGKGKVGDRQMKFYDRVLLKPYARAMQAVTRDRLDLGRSFKNIKKEFNTTPKDLKRKVPGSLFNKEQAVRIYIWDSIGKEVPGLSVDEVNELANYVADNKNLKEFAEQVMRLNPGSKYLSPKEGWETGTITTDLLETLNESRRAKHLERWQQNADAIFTKENLNKLEAVYGTSYRKAMENILTRMKTGRNRTYGTDSQTSKWLDWLNGSVGTIMFFNTRSAILQTLSATNFINFGDNNIFAAGKAFANQKQYWSDFAKLMNSEYLLERRDSLKINVNEADIADAARQRGARGAINYLLKLGFTPTKFADSFAIASGGATFYRNRLNAFIKKGMDPVAAEKAAMRDFIETAEESQQSSRPDKISQEQAGPLGRLVLAFANTPAQYARIIKKAASDLKNGRGDAKTNISKIMYYGVLQNVIFNALQQALFAIAFGDEEDEEMLDDKKLNIANGMLDSFIRGTGILGAVFTMVKNTGIKLYKESEKRNPKYGETAVFEALKISPPISSKASRMRAAGRTLSWEMDEIKEKGVDITNPAVSASASVVSALTNVPLDRVVRKVENLAAASNAELETYKRIALTLGWGKWELGIKEPKKKKKSKKRVSKIKVSGKKYSK